MRRRFFEKYQNMSLYQKQRYIILSLALPACFVHDRGAWRFCRVCVAVPQGHAQCYDRQQL